MVETILENNQSILYRNNSCDLQLDRSDIDKINFQEYSSVFLSGVASLLILQETQYFQLLKKHQP